jgi:hypothetical protein
MTGFEVRFKDRVIYAAADKGVLPVIVSYCHNSVHLSVTGYLNKKYDVWYSRNIDDVDEVTVKVVDVQQNSELAKSYSDNDIDDMLSEYSALKRGIEALKKEIEKEKSSLPL